MYILIRPGLNHDVRVDLRKLGTYVVGIWSCSFSDIKWLLVFIHQIWYNPIASDSQFVFIHLSGTIILRQDYCVGVCMALLVKLSPDGSRTSWGLAKACLPDTQTGMMLLAWIMHSAHYVKFHYVYMPFAIFLQILWKIFTACSVMTLTLCWKKIKIRNINSVVNCLF